MRFLHVFLFFLFTALAFAQAGNHTAEGGNITAVDVNASLDSTWHGVVGRVSPEPFVNVMLNATPGDLTSLTIKTGSGRCKHGVEALYILFSNSSSVITSLTRGNLTLLDDFISSPPENATATFLLSSTFRTENYGQITGVPTTYTNPPAPPIFILGYLQDQDGNLVFITKVLDEPRGGFNGSLFDFQLMLPTKNATPVMYYATVDLECKVPPFKPRPPPTGGGGTRTPYYVTPPEVPPLAPPGPPPEIVCDIVLYCDEWGPCIEGYRKQRCWDMENCSDIEVFRVEKCVPAEIPEIVEEIKEEIPIFAVQPEIPCLPFLLLLLLIVVIAYMYLRRKRKRGVTT